LIRFSLSVVSDQSSIGYGVERAAPEPPRIYRPFAFFFGQSLASSALLVEGQNILGDQRHVVKKIAAFFAARARAEYSEAHERR